MRVVSTFHPSSSVVDSLRCCLGPDRTEHLVVAHIDKLELYSLLPEGLVRLCHLGIYGRIVSIAAVPTSSHRSNLLVLLDHPLPELLLITLSGDALSLKRTLSLVEQGRPSEFLTKVIVNPAGSIAVVSCYVGKLRIIRLQDGDFDAIETPPLNIPELSLLDVIFLPFVSSTTISLLHLNSKREVQLLSREINIDDGPYPEISSPLDVLPKTIVPNKSLFIPTAETLPHLLAVEGGGDSENGVLVLGGKKLLLYTLADEAEQTKLRNKRSRLEKRKNSKDQKEIEEAKQKEMERENRKRKAKYEVVWPWSEITAIGSLNADSRWLVGDVYGRLSILSAESLEKQGLLLVPIGEASPPTSLTYLTSQYLFVGSFRGDSQLVKISQHPSAQVELPTLPISEDIHTVSSGALSSSLSTKGKQKAIEEGEERLPASGCIVKTFGSFLEVVQSFRNIGPILDAAISFDSTGETQIVTCSGGMNKGSLNILRSGADFRQLAAIEGLPNVTSIWPLRQFFEDGTHMHVGLSTTQRTYVLKLDSESSASFLNPSSRGIITSQPTLALCNVCRKSDRTYENGTFVVQVTPNSVRLLTYEMGLDDYERIGNEWTPPNGGRIVAASIHASLVAVGIARPDRHELLVLKMINLTDERDDIFEVLGRTKTANEIAAVSCVPLDRSSKTSHRISVAYWGTNTVEIFTFQRPHEQLLSHRTLPEGVHLPSLPRSILLFNFGSNNRPGSEDHQPYLLVGLSDGSVASFPYSAEGSATLGEYRIVGNIGPSPASLTPSTVNGRNTVFASGSRGALISWHNQHLRTSSILLKDVVSAACLNTAKYPSSFVLSTPSGLFIGSVPDLDQMHIRTVELGLDNPRRIAYDPHLRVFGLAINRAQPTRVGDPEAAYDNRFWVLDETTFEKRFEYNLPKDEVISSITNLSVGDRRFFCLGTYLYNVNEPEPTSGRIILLECAVTRPLESNNSQDKHTLEQVAEVKTPGAVYCLDVVDHSLLAATINSSITIYSPEPTNAKEANTTIVLYKLAEKSQHYLATSLDVYAQDKLIQRIYVGDPLGSIACWKLERTKQNRFRNSVKPEENPPPSVEKAELESVARDYSSLSPTAIVVTDNGGVLGGNLQTNLFSFVPVERQVATGNQIVLERDGFYHLGDMVNKFIRGSVAPKEASDKRFAAENIFFTSSGRIGVVVNITDQSLSLNLTEVERNLRYVIGDTGGISHAKFRTPRVTSGRGPEAAVGFMDGDFLERFLSLSPADLHKVVEGKHQAEKLKMPLNVIKEIVEKLQSLH